MTYDVDYFIAKFEAIPDDQWAVGKFEDGGGRKCAMGHCGKINGFLDTPESAAVYSLFIDELHFGVVSVNDGCIGEYPQHTPKQRILAALQDIKKKLDDK